MNTAKTTLVSTVMAAAFGLAMALMVAPAGAGHKPSHNPGGGGGGDPIVYTAEVTMGGFRFRAENFIANSKLNQIIVSLGENEKIELRRPVDDPGGISAWNAVFDDCPELLKPSDHISGPSISKFKVGNAELRVNQGGGVGVVIGYIVFNLGDDRLLDDQRSAEVLVQLRGRYFDFDEVSFLPVGARDTRTYTLEDYVIYGGTLSGISPRSGCKPRGSGSADTVPFEVEHEPFGELVITAN